jgi:crotonobetainyl-CoA:carnitine CoA-transferase CaiB-like acyl-CoA transferase
VAGWTFVPAFGDILGGFALASGIAAALFKRERSGEPSVIDVSLLGMATWHLSPDLVATGLLGEHTDEILEKELGLDWDAIVALKLNNTVN